MKKRVALILAMMGLFAIEAKAYDFGIRMNNGDSLFFNITDARGRYVAVTAPVAGRSNYYYGHVQPSGVVMIPETVDYNGQNYTVTAIGERAFSGCTKIQLVTMPATVREIGPYAFYGCTGMKGRVTIGVNVERVGESAFYGCSFLTEVNFRAVNCTYMGGSVSMTVFGNCRSLRKVLVDEGVRRIPDYAFCGLDGVTDSLVLPQSLEYIGNYAFAYCSSLSGRLVIPDKVESVGECAFHQCHALKSLTLGMSLKSVGGRAFYHCIGLKEVKAKSFFPTEIASTTFSDVPRTTKFVVPCVSKALYEKDVNWKKQAPFGTHGSCTFAVSAAMEDAAAGIVTGGGDYRYGDSATLVAICAAGYGFDRWTDGNTENPRGFRVTNDIAIKALTRPAGTVVVTDTIFSIDTVYAEGYKVIHDTVDLIEVARSINVVEEVKYDAEKKRLTWNLPRGEKVVNVSLFNQLGECVYSGDGRKGSVNMKRHTSGTYIVRIETLRRVIRCRFFMNADRGMSYDL